MSGLDNESTAERILLVSSAYLREREAHAFTMLTAGIAFLSGGVIIGLTFFGVSWFACGLFFFLQWILKRRRNKEFAKTVDKGWNDLMNTEEMN